MPESVLAKVTYIVTLVNFFIGPELKLHLKTCDMLVACSYQYQIGFQNGLLSAKVTEPPVLEP